MLKKAAILFISITLANTITQASTEEEREALTRLVTELESIEQIIRIAEQAADQQDRQFWTPKKSDVLNHVKEQQADVTGKDYAVRLWVLYDKSKEIPRKADLPLMAKYELKMTYERLRNIHKYSEISVSMIPVKVVNFKTAKSQEAN